MKNIKVFLYNTVITILLVEFLNQTLSFALIPQDITYYLGFYIFLSIIILLVEPILKFFIIKPKFYNKTILLTILLTFYFIGADLLYPGFHLQEATIFSYKLTGYIVGFIVSFIYAFLFYLIYELKD